MKVLKALVVVLAVLAPSLATAKPPVEMECEKMWDGQQGREVLRCHELDRAPPRSLIAPRSRAWDPITIGAQTLGAGLMFVPAVLASVYAGAGYSALGGYKFETSDFPAHTFSVGFTIGQAVIPATTTLVGRLVGGNGPWWSIAVGAGAGLVVGLPVALLSENPGATMGAAFSASFIGSMLTFHLAAKPRLREPTEGKGSLHVTLAPRANGPPALVLGGTF